MDIGLLFYDLRDALVDLRERGGPLISYIGLTILVMWGLVFERIIYFASIHQTLVTQLTDEWDQRSDHLSWYAHNIQEDLFTIGKAAINRNLSYIETCFMLCPLLGLMGTVTGMIDVFHVLAVTGGGDPKPMASGVSRATLPTLSGMVGALSGYAALVIVRNQASRSERQLARRLDHS